MVLNEINSMVKNKNYRVRFKIPEDKISYSHEEIQKEIWNLMCNIEFCEDLKGKTQILIWKFQDLEYYKRCDMDRHNRYGRFKIVFSNLTKIPKILDMLYKRYNEKI